MKGKKVKYHYYEKNRQSTITIPISIAKSLNWEDKDEIYITIQNMDGKVGLFLYKEPDKSREPIIKDDRDLAGVSIDELIEEYEKTGKLP